MKGYDKNSRSCQKLIARRKIQGWNLSMDRQHIKISSRLSIFLKKKLYELENRFFFESRIYL